MSILDKAITANTHKEPLKLCIYGRPGSGKTKLAAEAPNPIILDCERGHLTLGNHPHLRDVPIVPIGRFQDVVDAAFALKDGNHDRKTVIIDTVNTLEQKRLSSVLKEAAAKDGRSPYLPYQNDYKENGGALKSMLYFFSELNMNVIFVAHDVEIQDEDKVFRLRPALPPKLTETLNGLMDAVLHLSIEIESDGTVVRKLRTTESRRIVAKSRLNFGTDEVINPTFQDIWNAYERTTGEVTMKPVESAPVEAVTPVEPVAEEVPVVSETPAIPEPQENQPFILNLSQ